MRTLLAMVLFAAAASAATVTFEGYPGASGNPTLSSPTDIEGLTFSSSHMHIIGSPGSCGFGGCVSPASYMGVDGPTLGGPVTVTLTGGGLFSLTSFESSFVWNDSNAAAGGGFPNGQGILVVGYLSGGGTVTATFELGLGFAPHTLTGFDNLTSAVFSAYITEGTQNASFAADNISYRAGGLSQVPEPGTVALLGAGLGLLGLLRRKR